jgi:anti-sigma B factor antagonist
VTAEETPDSAGGYLPGIEFGQPNGDPLLRVAVVEYDQTLVVVQVAGEVDMLTGSLLQRHLDNALASQPQRLIVDLNQVSFMGSTGLAVLLNANTAARGQGTTVQLRGVGRAVARLLQLTQLAYLFEIVPDDQRPSD